MTVRLRFRKNLQRMLLTEFLDYCQISMTSAAELLDVGETTFKRWLNERATLPSDKFDLICEINQNLERYRNMIDEELVENWGQIKGGRSRVLKIQNMDQYLARIRNIKNKKRIESAYLIKTNRKIRNRLLINLLEEKIDLRYILATCLITDGSMEISGNSYRISYYTKDDVLRDFVKALLFRLSRFVPSETPTKKGVFTIRVNDNYLAKDLLKLSPSYKKNPSDNQSGSGYLKEVQPSLNFLRHTDEKTRIWCIRFAFSTDGSISISKSGTIELNLSCYNPKLAKQWLGLIKEQNINCYLGKNHSAWSGIDGVRIYDKRSLAHFANFGGFVPGVKISGKSKRYKGLQKNTLLKKALLGP
jgi:hypothetical protein